MTRDEHLKWAKGRAREYVCAGDLKSAVGSMISDLSKHDEFDGLSVSFLGMAGMLDANSGDADAVSRWIDGFN